ncbi:serine/threonine protein kinase [Fictibacillus sp. WQ 8-8]|uniref:serine/threonine protein kinase n=1 Tax=Fictibacillus sp. WQ 8-8 TaxID=2938788 RepID=UPI00210AF7A0|nr:serine/threonine-protein kinase [Fictibacillus sp. WQ 8-8]MCQ6266794.1 serine/threonine protein kinase [Fictibacillus sp. WQ 8-8]
MMFHWAKDLYRLILDRPLKPGTILFGRYRINKMLGMGSYGITYTALDKDSGKTVAVKQLRKTKAWTKAGRQFFERETGIHKQLKCPSIPSVHQAGQDKGRFIVMDYVSGKTFEDLIFEEGIRYTEVEALAVLKEVLIIISSFHEKGIVHRDLRIPNIISDHGKLHIIDFGLACRLYRKQEHHNQRKTVNNLMREVSVESDFYALGHFLLFLLYSNYEPDTKKEKSWEEELTLSPEVHRLIRRLLQIDESFRSAVEIIDEISFLLPENKHEMKTI